MNNLIQTLQTKLKRLARNVTYSAPPEGLELTTFGVITGDLTNPFGDKVFIYIRKNIFDLVTDLEIVITSGVLKNDVAIELIKPDAFVTADDLEDRLDDAIGRIISTLKINQEEYRSASSQLELFPTEDRELQFDLANRLN